MFVSQKLIVARKNGEKIMIKPREGIDSQAPLEALFGDGLIEIELADISDSHVEIAISDPAYLQGWGGSQQDARPPIPVQHMQAHSDTSDKRGFDGAPLRRDDKILVAHRRLFQRVQPRFIFGSIVAYQDDVAKVRGFSWVREHERGTLKKKQISVSRSRPLHRIR